MSSHSNQTCLSGLPTTILSTDVTCIDGFYCPNNTVEHPPEYCPPTLECQITRVQEAHSICDSSQGKYEPAVCRAGFYCPSGGQSELPCPKGHYCPLGTVDPFPCATLSVCPEGSIKQIHVLPFLCVGVLDLVLLLAWVSTYWRGSLWHKVTKLLSFSHGDKAREPEPEAGPRSRGLSLISNGDHPTGIFPSFVEKTRSREVEIQFRGISMSVGRSKNEILCQQNGKIRAGCLLGVMGPSGSGKSTLLNILAGRIKPTSGSIHINGEVAQTEDLKSLVGFVPQDDIVLADLTVRENILHSARIRIGNTLNDKEIQEFVDSLISNLGLSKVRNSLVGDISKRGISGGERKRVNVALELAAAPSILLLDEPTSGLDATTALSLVELLTSLSQQGVTIICVFHQPRVEIFNAMDDLLLLEAGKQVFFGQAEDAIYHLKTDHQPSEVTNPADLILDIISKPLGSSLAQLRAENEEPDKNLCKSITSAHGQGTDDRNLSALLRSAKQQRASWYKQVYLTFLRGTKQQARGYTSFVLEIMSGTSIGLLIGLSNYEFNGHLFQGIYHSPFEALSSATSFRLLAEQGMLCSLAMSCTAGPVGVRTFGDEKPMFYRESASGHSKSAYLLGKILCTVCRILLSSLHFTAFYMVLTTPIISFKVLLGLNFLYVYCIYGLGCVVAAITTPQNGPLLAMLVSLIITALTGCAPRLRTVMEWNLEWFWYLWPGVWYSEGVFTGNASPLSHIYNTQAAADLTGYTIGRIGFDAWLLFLIGSVYHLVSCMLLSFLAQRRGK